MSRAWTRSRNVSRRTLWRIHGIVKSYYRLPTEFNRLPPHRLRESACKRMHSALSSNSFPDFQRWRIGARCCSHGHTNPPHRVHASVSRFQTHATYLNKKRHGVANANRGVLATVCRCQSKTNPTARNACPLRPTHWRAPPPLPPVQADLRRAPDACADPRDMPSRYRME